MAQQVVDATDTLNAGRLKLNANDGEFYTHEARTDNPHGVTKAQVGLSSVDNTSDAAKPVSTAQQTALDLKENVLTPVVIITGTTVLTSSAYGKLHICKGTSADYTVTLPTAVGSEGKIICIVGDPDVAVLNKAITIEGDGSEKVGRYLNQVITTGGSITAFALDTVGVGSWNMINFDQGAYLQWTPTVVGLSGMTLNYRYKLGKGELDFITYHATTGTGAGTTFNFTLPRGLTANGVCSQVAATIYSNGALLATPGKIVVADGSNIVQVHLAPNAAATAWTGTGDREVIGTFKVAVN